MCTVVYIPDNDKVFFASLRDESPLRPTAITPAIFDGNQLTVLAPQDALAGGTWLGINDHKNVIILLNGGFEKHIHRTDYRKSRGLIVTDLLKTASPLKEWETLDLENIEPFTLMVWSGGMLFQLVWDGVAKHQQQLDESLPHILSSATLYKAEAKAKRTMLFKNWMATHPAISSTSLLDFFKSFSDSENGFIMNRNEKVKTLSYSFIELNNKHALLNYFELHSSKLSSQSIAMRKEETVKK